MLSRLGFAALALALARAAPLTLTTAPGATEYLCECGFYHPVDASVSIGGATALSSASVAIGGALTAATDVLEVDPDPHMACSYGALSSDASGSDCPPCPGLDVLGRGTAAITMVPASAAGPSVAASAFESCLRRVIFRSTAYGGMEDLGSRTVTFTVTTPGSPPSTATATRTIDEVAVDSTLCGALLSSGAVNITAGITGTLPYIYPTACNGGPCNFVLLAPDATLTTGSSGVVGFVQVWFDLFSRARPLTYYPEEDRIGFMPVPGATYADPCPGVTVRILTGSPPGASGAGGPVFRGVQLYGPASAAVYTACLRRAYYSNIAPVGGGTPGYRPAALRVGSVPRASGSSYMGITLGVNVTTPGHGAPCLDVGCGGPVPAGFPTPAPSPSVSRSPSPSASQSFGATPSPSSGPFLASESHARITWFASIDCTVPEVSGDGAGSLTSAGQRSIALVQQGACNTIPDSGAAYAVHCVRDAGTGRTTGAVVISFCEAGCGFCPSVLSVQRNQCVGNAPGVGARAFSISCAEGDMSVASLRPLVDDAYVRWIAQPGCNNELAGATHMLISAGICHAVPGGGTTAGSGSNPANSGVHGSSTGPQGSAYRISCDASGASGVFEVCDGSCSTCGVRTPFTASAARNDGLSDCIANPPGSGALSVRFLCGAGSHPLANRVPVSSGSEAAVAVGALGTMLLAGVAGVAGAVAGAA